MSNLLHYPRWQLQRRHAPSSALEYYDVEQGRMQGNQLVVKLTQCHNRDHAMQLTLASIFVNRTELPILAHEEYYWADLIGLNVTNTAGSYLGKVHEVIDTGANDVLIVINKQQRQLIPYIDHVIKTIDLEDSLMIVDWDSDSL